MTESNESYLDVSIWDEIKGKPPIIGFKINKNKSLDVLNALRDIYLLKTVEKKNDALTMLAGVFYAVADGEGDEIIEEVLVQEAMINFDEQAKGILNEES
jgi:hypothetical protein